jgi:hypothetical protein
MALLAVLVRYMSYVIYKQIAHTRVLHLKTGVCFGME